MFTNLFTALCGKSHFGGLRTTGRRRKNTGFKPRLESLEDRLAPATMIIGKLEFTSSNFAVTGAQVSASAAVQVGLKPQTGAAFVPELNLDNGVQFMTNDKTGTLTTNGSVGAISGSTEIPLLDAHLHTFMASLLASTAGFTLANDTNTTQLAVAGGELAVTNLRLTGKALEVQGSLTFTQLPGLVLPVGGTSHVAIDQNGAHLSGLDTNVAKQTFTSGGVKITLGSDPVTFNSTQQTFEIGGMATLYNGTNHVTVSLGSSAAPTLGIANGLLKTSNPAGIVQGLMALGYTPVQAGQFLIAGFQESDLLTVQALKANHVTDAQSSQVLYADFEDTAAQAGTILQTVYSDTAEQVSTALNGAGYAVPAIPSTGIVLLLQPQGTTKLSEAAVSATVAVNSFQLVAERSTDAGLENARFALNITIPYSAGSSLLQDIGTPLAMQLIQFDAQGTLSATWGLADAYISSIQIASTAGAAPTESVSFVVGALVEFQTPSESKAGKTGQHDWSQVLNTIGLSGAA